MGIRKITALSDGMLAVQVPICAWSVTMTIQSESQASVGGLLFRRLLLLAWLLLLQRFQFSITYCKFGDRKPSAHEFLQLFGMVSNANVLRCQRPSHEKDIAPDRYPHMHSPSITTANMLHLPSPNCKHMNDFTILTPNGPNGVQALSLPDAA